MQVETATVECGNQYSVVELAQHVHDTIASAACDVIVFTFSVLHIGDKWAESGRAGLDCNWFRAGRALAQARPDLAGVFWPMHID